MNPEDDKRTTLIYDEDSDFYGFMGFLKEK